MAKFIKCCTNAFGICARANKNTTGLLNFGRLLPVPVQKHYGLINACCITTESAKSGSELDDNERALQELDITLLKPHPEWRNVASGPVWGEGNEYFELLWKHWLDEPFTQRLKASQDEQWDSYVEKFGTSPIDYLSSEDYKLRYENKYTWHGYIRNKKGSIQKQKTRKFCMRKGVVSSGSPCALCRDDQLLLTYRNVPLLRQFIDEHTGELHSSLRTGLCQVRQKSLIKSLELAQELGFFKKIVPFVKYNLNDYTTNPYVV